MKNAIHEPRTTELLRGTLDAHSGETITLGDFIDPLGERAFGFLVLVLALPNFIPVPIGIGGVTGAFIIVTGVQMLVGLEHPWLPNAMRRRGFSRASVETFVRRITPLLKWLERLCRPRWESLARHPAHRISGFLLVLIGIALALPIPFTNYPFGMLLIAFAVALLERDGILLVIAWLASAAVALTLGTLGGTIIDFVRNLF